MKSIRVIAAMLVAATLTTGCLSNKPNKGDVAELLTGQFALLPTKPNTPFFKASDVDVRNEYHQDNTYSFTAAYTMTATMSNAEAKKLINNELGILGIVVGLGLDVKFNSTYQAGDKFQRASDKVIMRKVDGKWTVIEFQYK